MSEYKITLAEGVQYTTAWRNEYPNMTKAFLSDKAEMMEILNQTGAVGVRAYLGIKDGVEKLVMVAVDENGNDMLYNVYDHVKSCPPDCDVNSVLNNGE